MFSICKIYVGLFFFISLLTFSFSLYFLSLHFMLIIEYYLVSFNSSSIIMTIMLDWMSLMFMSFVLFISSMMIFYSEEYMSGDLYLNRFILLVVMFVLTMMLLIISPNLISILLGWDGLGLVSYCLVIYSQNVVASMMINFKLFIFYLLNINDDDCPLSIVETLSLFFL